MQNNQCIDNGYVYVPFPDSQDFEEYNEKDGVFVAGSDAGAILVPQEIYNKVYSK